MDNVLNGCMYSTRSIGLRGERDGLTGDRASHEYDIGAIASQPVAAVHELFDRDDAGRRRLELG